MEGYSNLNSDNNYNFPQYSPYPSNGYEYPPYEYYPQYPQQWNKPISEESYVSQNDGYYPTQGDHINHMRRDHIINHPGKIRNITVMKRIPIPLKPPLRKSHTS